MHATDQDVTSPTTSSTGGELSHTDQKLRQSEIFLIQCGDPRERRAKNYEEKSDMSVKCYKKSLKYKETYDGDLLYLF